MLILLLDPGGTRTLNLLDSYPQSSDIFNRFSKSDALSIRPLGHNNCLFELILHVIYGEKSKANTDLTVRTDFMDSDVVNQGLWSNG